MAFYQPNSNMSSQLRELLNRFDTHEHPGLLNSISVTWIKYDCPDPSPSSGHGAGWEANRPTYPASVIKLFYAVAIEAWLQKDLLEDNEELRRALKDMISDSSNDATSFIVDLLTGTSSGPSISGERWQAWKKQRGLINKWLDELNWPELKSVNCCQKTWNDGPYGRERDFYGTGDKNRNSLTTEATARMLEAVMTDGLVSPRACRRIKSILSRTLDLNHRKGDPENQVDGFIGEGLPKGSRLWSKAGLMSQVRHDAAWISLPSGNPMLLVIFSLGRHKAKDTFLLPLLAKELIQYDLEK